MMTNPGGGSAFYTLILAGLNPDKPEMIVIEKSEKKPNSDLSFVEHATIVTFAKLKGIPVVQQAVYSEKDHDRYALVRLEERGTTIDKENPQKRVKLYGHQRDHGSNFDKEEIYEDLRKIVQKCEHIETQNQQMRSSQLAGGDASLQEEIKKLREAAEKELQQELEQGKKK